MSLCSLAASFYLESIYIFFQKHQLDIIMGVKTFLVLFAVFFAVASMVEADSCQTLAQTCNNDECVPGISNAWCAMVPVPCANCVSGGYANPYGHAHANAQHSHGHANAQHGHNPHVVG